MLEKIIRSLPARLQLGIGDHSDPRKGMCAMEAVAWMAGLKHSSAPECTCPVIGIFVRTINDHMDDQRRQRLKPLLASLIGTCDERLEVSRTALLVKNALIRFAPMALKAVGLDTHAAFFRKADPNDLEKIEAIAKRVLLAANRIAHLETAKRKLPLLESPARLPIKYMGAIEVARAASITAAQAKNEDETNSTASAASWVIANTGHIDSAAWKPAIALLEDLIRMSQSYMESSPREVLAAD